MSEKIYSKRVVAPSHPGEILKSGFIETHNLAMETVSELLGLARGHLSRIVNAHSPVTPDIAIRLELLTHVPASQWLALQAKYDAYLLEHQEAFRDYKQTIDDWLDNSLPMTPRLRRANKISNELIARAGSLAKQINRSRPLSKLILGRRKCQVFE